MTVYPSEIADADVGSAAAIDASSMVAALSAEAAATAAGYDETIPRTFLALFDVTVLFLGFVATSLVAPWVQWLLLPSGPLYLSVTAQLVLPSNAGMAAFPSLVSMAWVLAITIPATLLFMEILGGYRQLVEQSRSRLVGSSVLATLISLGFVTLTLFALKIPGSSRVFIFTYGALGGIGLVVYRAALRVYKKRRLAKGAYAKNVVLVGQPSAVIWISDHFAHNVPANRFQLVGWLSVDSTAKTALVRETSTAQQESPDLPCLGTLHDLRQLLVNNPLHEVIAIQSSADCSWLTRVIEDCDYFRVCVRIVPEALLVSTLRDLKLMFRSKPLQLPEVVLAPPHLESDALFVKRLMDIVVSGVLLITLAPLFLFIALAIKLTTPRLPALYPWRVIGLKGRAFTGYKFTTMTADADARFDELKPRNEMHGPVFKLKDDPRVTPLGRILRKYSLNELPQLWSVLKGDMSLVGPRPAFRHELARYELWQKRKLCVKPGITCLWQVSGRNRINKFDDWVRLDLQYIDQWSLWLDVRILARTARAVIAGTGS